MDNLIYREIRKDDYRRVRELINEAFNFEKLISDKKILDNFLEVYLRGCLMGQNYTEVVEQNGEVIGLIFGKTNKDYSFFKNANHVIPFIKSIVAMTLANKKQGKEAMPHKKVINAYKELIKDKEDRFEGKIELFIVGEKCRGKGIGKKLINNYLDFCKNKSAKNIYVFTDASCNYEFYNRSGFNRVDQRLVDIKTEKQKMGLEVYLYSYEIMDK